MNNKSYICMFSYVIRDKERNNDNGIKKIILLDKYTKNERSIYVRLELNRFIYKKTILLRRSKEQISLSNSAYNIKRKTKKQKKSKKKTTKTKNFLRNNIDISYVLKIIDNSFRYN